MVSTKKSLALSLLVGTFSAFGGYTYSGNAQRLIDNYSSSVRASSIREEIKKVPFSKGERALITAETGIVGFVASYITCFVWPRKGERGY